MKESYYNFLYKLDGIGNVIYNSITNALAVLEDEIYLCFMEKRILDIPEEISKQLEENGFLIKNEIDEISILEHQHNLAKYTNKTLNLTIAPTLQCNMKCSYCYETEEAGIIGNETADRLFEFINEGLKLNDGLDITWYGGEPLIAKDFIITFSKKITELCSRLNKTLNLFMITNGYLFNEIVIDNLVSAGIKRYQITLEGTKDLHDSRRMLKSGGGSFNKIIDNIKLLKLRMADVIIRINIDYSNINEIENLIMFLKDEGLNDIHLYLGKINTYTDKNARIASRCLFDDDYSSTVLKFQTLLRKHGFEGREIYPEIKHNYCMADNFNSLVIDHNGYLYKCFVDIGNHKCACGHLNEENNPSAYMNSIRYFNASPFKDAECFQCKYLPNCMGGCPYLFLQNNSRNCLVFKDKMEEFMQMFIVNNFDF